MSLPLTFLVMVVVPLDGSRVPRRLDVLGAAGLVLILTLVLLPLSTAGDVGLGPLTVVPAFLGIALVPVWAWGRLHRDDPVVDLRTLRGRPMAATHVTAAATGFTGFMCFVVTSYALQVAKPLGPGLTLTDAGLVMTPAAVSFLAVGPLTSRLILRLGMRRTFGIGGGVTALGAAGVALTGTELTTLVVSSFVVFIGNGVLQAALPVASGTFAPADAVGGTNGVNALARTLGIAVASGVFALVVGTNGSHAPGAVLAWSHAASAGVAVLVVVLSTAIPRRASDN